MTLTQVGKVLDHVHAALANLSWVGFLLGHALSHLVTFSETYYASLVGPPEGYLVTDSTPLDTLGS